ncbi:copper ion transmembrane transporter [Actinidia rufa]|uniref:Copper ion transmembrane transporter n=1 Tax=Actinidia rufa TaxID=165716 RepID=A0A7J0EBY6_9ERIC|nr:copper ion transmembrane transporter [Actinidia rufa]
MGGGPRTYPGGVSKWQWKRMQAKKSKQLLKAQLARERQIYEMRKRAELKAAVAQLERPWEPVERPTSLFSVHADEQVKVLADRFQRPGGFDLWSESDGPHLFTPGDAVPSARFFPKGAENGEERSGYSNSGRFGDGLSSEGLVEARDFSESVVRSGRGSSGKFKKKEKLRRVRMVLENCLCRGLGMVRKGNGYSNSGRFSDGSSIGGLGEARNSSESVDRSRKGSNGEVGFEGERRMETPGRRTSNHRLSREVGFEGKRIRESPGRRTGSHRLRYLGLRKKVRGRIPKPFNECNMWIDGFQAENWD